MTITIVAPGEYIDASKSTPIVGRSYVLEDAATGTTAQGNAFHALAQEYYKSGCWSYEGSGYNRGATFAEFRNIIKKKLGAGFEAFVYVDMVDGEPVIRDAERYEDIPESVRRDPRLRSLARGRLKSWADYTKTERTRTIDNLIAEMHQVGVQSKHFYEILEGMEGEGK